MTSPATYWTNLTDHERRVRVVSASMLAFAVIVVLFAPDAIRTWLLVVEIVAFFAGAAAHFQARATKAEQANIWGPYIVEENEKLKSTNLALQRQCEALVSDNMALTRDLDDTLGRLGTALDDLVFLETEHALCSSNVTGVVVDIAEHRKGGGPA